MKNNQSLLKNNNRDYINTCFKILGYEKLKDILIETSQTNLPNSKVNEICNNFSYSSLMYLLNNDLKKFKEIEKIIFKEILYKDEQVALDIALKYNIGWINEIMNLESFKYYMIKTIKQNPDKKTKYRNKFWKFKKSNFEGIDNKNLAHIFPLRFLMYIDDINKKMFEKQFSMLKYKKRFQKIYENKINYIVLSDYQEHKKIDTWRSVSVQNLVLSNSNVSKSRQVAFELVKSVTEKYMNEKDFINLTKKDKKKLILALKILENESIIEKRIKDNKIQIKDYISLALKLKSAQKYKK